MKRLLLPLLIILCLSGCMKFTQVQDKANKDEKSDNLLSSNSEQESDSLYPVIKDNIHEIDNTLLKEIVTSYFLVFDFDMSFNEDDLVDYERAFQYIRSAGTYPIEPFEYWKFFEDYYDSESDNYTIPVKLVDKLISEKKIKSSQFAGLTVVDDNYIVDSLFWTVRSELHQYFNKGKWILTVPSEIVDEYILSKFNTKIDHSQIKEYDENSQIYTYESFTGSFHYAITIEEVIVDDEILTCKCILTNEIQESQLISYKVTFVIKLVDGEYKFLSVDIKYNNI
ncbi:hypothetical protein [Vallitalea maricola]|uniref:Uncharacterized protein n=1 Tax=Vallitalea maricola TaxID=3074433 RepID=A0ACB5UJT8_9FIRM|nr:hypothetical protein AN2V17_24540 [Vallitalea sp. AN17-2]